MTASRIRFITLILYLSIFGGAIGVFAKMALPAFTPLTTIFFRVFISIAIFSIYLAAKQILILTVKKILRHWKLFTALAITSVGAAMIAGFIGLRYTTAMNYGLIYNLSAVFILILSVIFLKEKMGRLDIALIISAFVGAAIIATNGKFQFDISQSYFLGNILVLISAFGWAVYTVIGAKYIKENEELDPMTVNFGTFLISLVALMPIVFATPKFGITFSAVNFNTVGGLLGLCVFSTAILFFLWFKFIDEAGGLWATFIALSENLTGVILPIIFLGEILTAPIIIGGLLMIFSIFGKDLFGKHSKQMG